MKKTITLFSALLVASVVLAQTPVLIKNINPDSQESSIGDGAAYSSAYFKATPKGKIFFPASDNDNLISKYPYISDGTEAGTIRLADAVVTNAQVYDPIKDRYYFTAYTDKFPYKDQEVWVSDGTEAGTKILKDIEPGANGSDPTDLMMVGSKLFIAAFSGANSGLWVSDGTDAGTKQLTNKYVSDFASYNGKLYFKGYDVDPNTSDAALWESDGTVAGTKKIYNPADFTEKVSAIKTGAKGLYIFIGSQGGVAHFFDLKTNKPIKLHGFDVSTKLFTLKGKDYLLCSTGPTATAPINELRETDGTLAGTKTVLKLKSLGYEMKVAETYFAFTATGTNGEELWISDATAAGTFEIDLNKGTGNSSPSELTRIGNSIYFSASYNNGTDYGVEPMVTDGTVAGTKLIADMAKGATSSNPRHFTLANFGGKNNLVFACEVDKTTGFEPYKLEIKVTTDTKDAIVDETLFHLQPNPTTNTEVMMASSLKGANAQLQVYDMQGRLVKKEKITNETQYINLNNMNKGIYFFQLISDDARTKTEKLIIQ